MFAKYCGKITIAVMGRQRLFSYYPYHHQYHYHRSQVAKSDRMLGFLKRNYSGDLNKESLKLLQLVPFKKKLKSFSL